MIVIISIEYLFLTTGAYFIRKSREFTYFWWILTAIVFSVTLSNYVPNISQDLYRYFHVIEQYRFHDFKYATNQYYFKYSPLYPLYFFLMSRFKSNWPLIGLTTFLDYILVFWVLKRFQTRIKVTNTGTFFCYCSVLLFIDLLNITGIRSMTATIIVMAGIYFDYIEHKSFSFLFYVIGGLFHSSLWLVAIVRLVFFLLKKMKIMFLILPYLIGISFFLIFSGTIPFYALMLKLYSITNLSFFYALGNQLLSYSQRYGSNGTLIILFALATLLRFVLIRYVSRKLNNNRIYEMITVPFTIAIIGLSIFNVPSASIRFFVMSNVVSLPSYWIYMSHWVSNNEKISFTTEMNLEPKSSIICRNIILATYLMQLIYLFGFQYIQFS